MYLFNPLTQAIGTPSAPQPPVFSQGAGPSTAPIIVESSSSDEPMAQAPEQGVTASQVQHEEIRFKAVSYVPAFTQPIRFYSQPIYSSFLLSPGTRHPRQQPLFFCGRPFRR